MSNNFGIDNFQINDSIITDSKVGDDANISQSKIQNLEADLGSKIQRSGGTMTGVLTLSEDPTQALQAAPKQYVDLKVNNISGQLDALVSIQGLKMSWVDSHTISISSGAIRVSDYTPLYEWNFNEGAGTLAYDNINDRNLTLSRTYSWSVDSFINTSTSTSGGTFTSQPYIFGSIDSFSVALWVKPTTYATSTDILALTGPGGDSWNIDCGTNNFRLRLSTQSTTDAQIISGPGIDTTSKYLVVLTYNRVGGSGAFKITKDGVNWFDSTFSGILLRQSDINYLTNFRTEALAAQFYKLSYFPDKVLTDPEIQSIWNAGSEGINPVIIPPTNPSRNLYKITSDSTLDFHTIGVGGLDKGTLQPNKFYYIYQLVDSSSNTTGIIASLTATLTTLPGSFTGYKMIGAIATDSSGNIKPFKVTGNQSYRKLIFDEMILALNNSATQGIVSFASYIPLGLTTCPIISMRWVQSTGTAVVYIRKGNVPAGPGNGSATGSNGTFSFYISCVTGISAAQGQYNYSNGMEEGEFFVGYDGTISIGGPASKTFHIKGYVWDL